MTGTANQTAASIHARLKKEAEGQGRPFEELLQYYGIERFLYRLSRSKYMDKFILKGGLLFYGWSIPLRRPTRDVDFRGYCNNSDESVRQAIKDVIVEPVPDDGIMFDPLTIAVERTQIDADYVGVRAKFTGYLGRTRIPMQIDIGFSDVLATRAEQVDYPTLLSDTKSPRLKGYPRESIVSEKFHAMIRLATLNSRFKDYYDIWLLVENFEFDGRSLQKAIEKTFVKRQTEIPIERPSALTVKFAKTNQGRWTSFLNKSNLQSRDVNDFAGVVNWIWLFLEYPIRLSQGDKPSKQLHWSPRTGWK